MASKRLDSRTITAAAREAAEGGRRIEISDSVTEGLFVRVEPTGKATFGFRYRVARGERRFRLGTFGAQLTVEQARKAARAARADVERGADPQGARAESRKSMVLADAFDAFMNEPGRRGDARKPRTVELYRQIFRDHIAPTLGRSRVDAITATDVERLKVATARRIGKGRGHGQAAAAVANRTLTLLSAILGAAERWGVIPRGSNPCSGVDRFQEQRRERYLRPEERAALEQAIMDAERRPLGSPGSLAPTGALALRLLIWTGARTSEITGLRWGWVDLERSCLWLPDSKSGATRVPLTPPAVELLRAHRPENPEPDALVCPSRHRAGDDEQDEREETPIANLGRVWSRVRQAAGLAGVRKHDLRHSFASDALNAGVSLAHVGAMLGHRNPATTARYAHVADDAVRAAADAAGQAIANSIAAGAAVVRLPVAAKGKAPSKSKGTSKRAE